MTRRDVLAVAAAAVIAPWSGSAWAADPPKPGMAPPPNVIASADALKRLLEGNERYVKNELKERDSSAGRAARVQAQYPFAATLSCADSRVTPADRAEVLGRQEDRHRGRRVPSRQRQRARVTQ
jgi:carbonic anhydrase